MEILDKIGEVASQTYKYTAEKADKIARETKLKMKMNENKSKIETLYNEIGESVYRRHIATTKENFDEEIQNACEEIDKISREIEQQNNELLNLKDRKQCPNCHEKIEKEAKYCSNCGMEQKQETKETEQEVKTENKEEIISEEKEEVNNAIATNATEEEKASNDSNEA